MDDPLSTPAFRVRREHQDRTLYLVLESREIRRTRRAQSRRDLVAWALLLALVGLVVGLDLVMR